jgi:diguanylate cyclase (GGDEF)-like protein/PAS domain S-box-containing protein
MVINRSLQHLLDATPLIVSVATPILNVLGMLERQRASCAVALDAEARPAGIFTERDAVDLIARNQQLDGLVMGAVMRQPVLSVAADSDPDDAYSLMLAHGYRHLAVVDAQGRLIGIVGEGDFLRHLGASRMRSDVERQPQPEQRAEMLLQIHALNASGNAIVITDSDAHIVWANTAFTRLTGFSQTEALGRKPSELVGSGKQDAGYYQQMWQTILAGGIWHGELVNKRKDGSLYDEDLTITPVRSGRIGFGAPDAAGDAANAAISHFIAVKQDISERKAAERNLLASEAHFRLFYENAPVAYQALDASGRVLEINAEWSLQFGYPRADVIGHHIGEFLVPGQEARLQANFEKFFGQGAIRKVEYDFRHQAGGIVTVSVDGVIERDANGNFTRTQCVLHNITARKEVEQELRRLAATDVLTGIANRRHFLDQMRLALARHHRHKSPTALLMIDLDWFKRVNDIHGHAVGDIVLRHYADIIQASLRLNDLLGRLGGEEFAILLSDTETQGAFEFAERIRQRATLQAAQTEAGEISVSLSIGVTSFAADDANIDAILARADRALYRAKRNGRNRVELDSAAPPTLA